MLLQELIHTEETYVSALRKLVFDFIEPLSTLEESRGSTTTRTADGTHHNSSGRSTEIDTNAASLNKKNSSNKIDNATRATSVLQKKYGERGLFQGMNAREIYGLNQYLLADLQRIITPLLSESGPTVGQDKHIDKNVANLFLHYTPQMAMYSVYCESYQTMLERIEVARDSECVNAYFSEIELQSKCSLQSLLIQPVQRLPRYIMLLVELIKNSEGTGDMVPASSPLQKALDAISEIAQRVNEQLRSFEERKKVFSLSRRILGSPDLIAPSRTFIRSGMLMKVSRARRSRPYHFFLFSDGALVYASPLTKSQDTEGPKKKPTLGSPSAPLTDSETFTFRRKLTILGVNRKPHSASLRLMGTPKSISVCASSISEADEWCNAFQTCFQSLIASPTWSHGRRQSVKSRARNSRLASSSSSPISGSHTMIDRIGMNSTRTLGSGNSSSAWNMEARSKS